MRVIFASVGRPDFRAARPSRTSPSRRQQLFARPDPRGRPRRPRRTTLLTPPRRRPARAPTSSRSRRAGSAVPGSAAKTRAACTSATNATAVLRAAALLGRAAAELHGEAAHVGPQARDVAGVGCRLPRQSLASPRRTDLAWSRTCRWRIASWLARPKCLSGVTSRSFRGWRRRRCPRQWRRRAACRRRTPEGGCRAAAELRTIATV